MAINNTSKFGNIQQSIIRFFYTEIEKTLSIPIYFDRDTFDPDDGDTQWYAFGFGDVRIVNGMSSIPIECFACTKSDVQGIDVSGMRDIILGAITDLTDYQSIRRIPLYNIVGAVWTEISKIYFQTEVPMTGPLNGPQGIKFIKMLITAKTPSG
jgi:hypothetical protein